MKKKQPEPPPYVFKFPRSDPDALDAFDPSTRRCTQNCSQISIDPRSRAEMKFQCTDCEHIYPPKIAEAVGWQYRFKRPDGTWGKWGDCPRHVFESITAIERPEIFETRELVPRGAVDKNDYYTLITEKNAADIAAKKQRVLALGNLKKGRMNKTEAAYAQRLELLQRAGEVLWWKFEAIKLRLADNTHLTVDFAVMLADRTLQMHDVKGAPGMYTDEARVKMKVLAELYPFPFFIVYPIPRSELGRWHVEEV